MVANKYLGFSLSANALSELVVPCSSISLISFMFKEKYATSDADMSPEQIKSNTNKIKGKTILSVCGLSSIMLCSATKRNWGGSGSKMVFLV
jgi:hypothetical protein